MQTLSGRRDSLRRLFSCLVFCIVLCPVAQAAEPLARLSWLAGDWRLEGTDLREHYSRLEGGTIMGTSRAVRGGKTVHAEFMVFETRPDGIYLTEWFPADNEVIRFKLTATTERGVAFETFDRPQHDRLTYERIDADRMRITLIKDLEGKPQTRIFPMRRNP